jgi:hypothetical protein
MLLNISSKGTTSQNGKFLFHGQRTIEMKDQENTTTAMTMMTMTMTVRTMEVTTLIQIAGLSWMKLLLCLASLALQPTLVFRHREPGGDSDLMSRTTFKYLPHTLTMSTSMGKLEPRELRTERR